MEGLLPLPLCKKEIYRLASTVAASEESHSANLESHLTIAFVCWLLLLEMSVEANMYAGTR
jgi:hypothetical protein